MRFIKQIFCFHLNWSKGHVPLFGGVGENWREQYWHCNRCQKNKLYSRFKAGPIQYIAPNSET